MNGRFLINLALLVSAALSAALSACSDPKVDEVPAKASWVVLDNPFDVKSSEFDFSIDFGPTAIGSNSFVEIQVTNTGGVPIVISPFPNLDGFVLDFSSPFTLNVASSRSFKLSFSPSEEKPYNASGIISVADHPDLNLTLSLQGVGHTPAFTCDAKKLDFGKVLINRTVTRSFECRNNSDVDGVLVVSTISGQHASLFARRFDGDIGDGRLALQSKGSATIDVIFKADVQGGAWATLPILHEVNNLESEAVTNISLEGYTVGHAIECTPADLDFGFVAPGQVESLEITCINNASLPFEISSVSLDPLQDNRFSSTSSAPIVIPAFANETPGQAVIDVTFAPTSDDLGERKNAKIILLTNDETSSRIELPLTGFAGGPVISCSPSSIDFGPIDMGFPAVRSFTCYNVGVDDPVRTDDNLLVTKIESSDPDAFSATVRGTLDTNGYSVGLEFTVDVTYHPVGADNDSAKILIHSNDTVRPRNDPYFVNVRGIGHDLPPCEFIIVPEQVSFGNVPREQTQTLDFAVRNLSPDDACLIQDLRLAPTCAEEFSLTELGAVILEKDSELRFPITFAPKAYKTAPYTCDVLFDISHPTNREQSVPVRAFSLEPCLLVTPSAIDFGSVKPGGCSSTTRQLEILNICTSSVTYSHVELDLGSSSSEWDEFIIVSEPLGGTRLFSGESLTFEVRYKPFDEGLDRGSVLIYVEGSEVPYTAALSGTGDYNAIQTDTFRQQDRAKVDILWVIDNSGSMAPAQEHMAKNMSAFLEIADTQGIDYHIGVTTTGFITNPNFACDSPGGVRGVEKGRLFPVIGSTPDHPRIITPETKNLEAVWAENFKVGTCHGYEETFRPAVAALTPPLSDNRDDPSTPEDNDGNLDFLRPDAYLSVISVSDELEQSPDSVSYYFYEFLKIKGVRNPDLFAFHAITGPPDVPCGSGLITAEANPRTHDMVKRAKGVVESFCTSDWRNALERMSRVSFGYQSCFKLYNVPAEINPNGIISDIDGELLVKTNGVVTPSVSVENLPVWSYNASDNTICFTSLFVPHPGAQLEVTYSAACGGE